MIFVEGMTPPEQHTGDPIASGDMQMDADAFHDLLSNHRRRFVFTRLQNRSTPMAVADIATALTQWETDTQGDRVPKDEIHARYVALYHNHIPKMDDMGVVEWDQERNTVILSEELPGSLKTDRHFEEDRGTGR